MAGLVFSLAAPAQADDLEDLAIGQAWRGWSDARLVVPTVGLPYELNPTPTAFSRSYIDAVPGRSSGFASFYYADEIPEEGIFEIGPGGGFKNPTLTRCNNPDAGRGTSGSSPSATASPTPSRLLLPVTWSVKPPPAWSVSTSGTSTSASSRAG
jgi:hypothetical protein